MITKYYKLLLTILYSSCISLFVLKQFYYWFAIANRYEIFLYEHLGASPFETRTSSRYWMAGLVAMGMVLIIYTILSWLLGRVAGIYYKKYTPPPWWQIWLLCFLPLSIGIPLITMTVNQPTLTANNALACVIAVLIGLALALSPAPLASQEPLKLGWLAVSSLGLVPSLLLLRSIEQPSQGLATPRKAYSLAVISIVIGCGWLVSSLYLQKRVHKLNLQTHQLLISAFCISYLLLPLFHYTFLVPPDFRYISNSANFFALNPFIQLLSFLITCIIAIILTKLLTRFT